MASIPNVSPLSMSLIATQVYGNTSLARSLHDSSREAYRQNNAIASLNVDPNAISEFKGWTNGVYSSYVIMNQTSGTTDYMPLDYTWSTTVTKRLTDYTYDFTLVNLPSFINKDITISPAIQLDYFKIKQFETLTIDVVLTIYKNGVSIKAYNTTISCSDYGNRIDHERTFSYDTHNSEEDDYVNEDYYGDFNDNHMVRKSPVVIQEEDYVISVNNADSFRVVCDATFNVSGLDARWESVNYWDTFLDTPYFKGNVEHDLTIMITTNFFWTKPTSVTYYGSEYPLYTSFMNEGGVGTTLGTGATQCPNNNRRWNPS